MTPQPQVFIVRKFSTTSASLARSINSLNCFLCATAENRVNFYSWFSIYFHSGSMFACREAQMQTHKRLHFIFVLRSIWHWKIEESFGRSFLWNILSPKVFHQIRRLIFLNSQFVGKFHLMFSKFKLLSLEIPFVFLRTEATIKLKKIKKIKKFS